MAVKKSYSRYFIIFQEEDKGFGCAIDKQPTGYTKIETKNGRSKITVYVQNLVMEKGPYSCMLIDAEKTPAEFVNLGEVKVDDTGRGETWWEFPENDIGGTSNPVDRFNVAAVIVEGTNIISPLAGYAGHDRISWKDKLSLKTVEHTPEAVKKEENKKEEEVPENMARQDDKLDEEAKKFKEYEEKIRNEINEIEKGENAVPVSEKETETKIEIEDEAKETINNQAETENIETEDKADYEDSIRGDAPVGRTRNEIEKEENVDAYRDFYDIEDEKDDSIKYESVRHKDEEKRKFASMFHKVLRNYEEIEKVPDELPGSRWWRIPLNDNMQMTNDMYYTYYCTIHHLKMTYPYINYIKYIKKTGSYCFGIKYDEGGEVSYIMYGIEGGDTPSEQPYMGMTGFTKWIKHPKKDTGMWIMYYNPYTGCMMIPKKR